MAPGLKKLLELIKATPNDQRLIDRFVSLSKELTVDERADAAIQLAQILATKVPVKAIDLAWGLFKEGHLLPDSLKVVSTALDALGKSGKAVAIREDARRLTVHPAGTNEHESARRSIQQAILATLTAGSGNDFAEMAQTKTSQKPIDTGDISKPSVNVSDTPSFSLESTSANADMEKPVVPKRDVEMMTNDASPTSEPVGRKAIIDKHDVDKVNPVASVARASAAAPGAGIPEAIPKKEASHHSKALHERLERVSSQQVTRSSAAESRLSVAMPSPRDPAACRVFVKELISESRWSDLLLFFDEVFEDRGDPLMVELFHAHKLAKIDLEFAARWVDSLIANRQERRALRFMHQLLIDEPHLSWAKMVKSKLDLVTERLRLRAISWREAEGVSALRLQIEQVRPKLGLYIALPPIAS